MSGRSTPRPRVPAVAVEIFTRSCLATAHNLPPELVLDILDIEITASRDRDATRARQLMLVSRAVRKLCLARLYEVLYINVRSGWHSATHEGWDGRRYRTRGLAFLSWLLHNPEAPPRRHVRHLVLNHDTHFTGVEVTAGSYSPGWGTPAGGVGAAIAGGNLWPSLWTVPRLTIQDPSDAMTLMAAGIQSTQVFVQDWTRTRDLHRMAGEVTSWPAAARWAQKRAAVFNLNHAYFRYFPQQIDSRDRDVDDYDDDSDWGRPVDRSAPKCVLYSQLYGTKHSGLDQMNNLAEGTFSFFIELDSSEATSASNLQSAIIDVLSDRSLARLHIVLVCEPTFRVEGTPMEELLIETQSYGLSREDLARVSISYRPWQNLDAFRLNPSLALARMN